MTVVAMTRREFSRLEVVVAIEEGQISVSRAAELLGLSRRQIFRLLDRFRSIGPNGLASRKRGVPSNNQIHRSVRQLAMMLVRQHLIDDWDLTDVFAWKEERTVSNALTLQYDKVMFLLEPNEVTRPLARKRVTVYDYPDGRVAIRHEGRDLPYRIFDTLRKVDQAAVVENKRLGAALAYVAERQKQYDEQRSQKAPRRRGQRDRHVFRTA
jgi:transposase-like protein